MSWLKSSAGVRICIAETCTVTAQNWCVPATGLDFARTRQCKIRLSPYCFIGASPCNSAAHSGLFSNSHCHFFTSPKRS